MPYYSGFSLIEPNLVARVDFAGGASVGAGRQEEYRPLDPLSGTPGSVGSMVAYDDFRMISVGFVFLIDLIFVMISYEFVDLWRRSLKSPDPWLPQDPIRLARTPHSFGADVPGFALTWPASKAELVAKISFVTVLVIALTTMGDKFAASRHRVICPAACILFFCKAVTV